MKKHLLYFSVAIFAGLLFGITATKATVISITVSSMAFTPNTVTASVGDTIRWTWVSGFHTTSSTTIPNCATAWNTPMDSSGDTLIYVLSCAGTYNYQCNPHLFTGVITAVATGMDDRINTPPSFFIYPSESNDNISVDFILNKTGIVKLELYDIIGRQIAVLINEEQTSGNYSRKFQLDKRLKTGIYIMRLSEGTQYNQSLRFSVK